jgi:extracellular factor (EF) 3-hydroxypalmitic acid methyl ester biosynthesis protein
MNHHIEFLKHHVAKGGPNVEDFYDLDAWITEIAGQVSRGNLKAIDLSHLRETLGDAISTETMQGFVFQKPHGYAGDYEIIDRIYTRYISEKPHLSNWDIYMQDRPAVHAVRNRLEYFCRQLEIVSETRNRLMGCRAEVLNLASGPGRDMLVFFDSNPEANIHFDCVEQDQNAVNYAQFLCANYLHKMAFHLKNVLKFQSEKKYDLIWSAGLFDYFDDKTFIYMLKKLGAICANSGEIIVGNFSTTNPSRDYMELFEWHLRHRSPTTLKALAAEAGFSANQVRVEKERLGVNLFLHIKTA